MRREHLDGWRRISVSVTHYEPDLFISFILFFFHFLHVTHTWGGGGMEDWNAAENQEEEEVTQPQQNGVTMKKEYRSIRKSRRKEDCNCCVFLTYVNIMMSAMFTSRLSFAYFTHDSVLASQPPAPARHSRCLFFLNYPVQFLCQALLIARLSSSER